jgi:VanZ family protein
MLKIITDTGRSKNKWFLPLAFLGTWSLVMYALSAQPTLTSSQEWMLLTPIRKGAHIIEFTILTLIAWTVFNQLHLRKITQFKSPKLCWWVTITLPFVFAVLDETHQYFVPNRQAKVSDVVIDSLGIGLATGLIWLWQNGYFNHLRRAIPALQQGNKSLGQLHGEHVHLMR